MKRTPTLPALILTLLVLVQSTFALAQTKYWTGGSGLWNDAAHWSNSPDGNGGAGVPNDRDDVVIDPARPITIALQGQATCKGLSVNGENAAVQLTGAANAGISIAGTWQLKGAVQWNAEGNVELTVRREGVEVDLRGIPVRGSIILNGSGSWSVLSAMTTAGDLRLQQGTLITNGNVITAHGLIAETNAQKQLIAGNALVALDTAPDRNALRDVVVVGSSALVVNGAMEPWGFGEEQGGDRDVNTCGTGAGQTPFTVTTSVVSNYNGFGVQCRGNCNATVTVTVSGGSGNFTYLWLNGGPPTATWTTACGGPQLVVVTDFTQGISCPVQIVVNEPAPLGVIFFGQSTPPTCADVCNGTRTSAAIGGVPGGTGYGYNWNNGAGTSSSFNMLCAGANTLRITDANSCIFDTTFFFNVQPIAPSLTFNDAGCNGVCDGTATVAPVGGTGAFTVTWSPQPIVTTDQFNAVQLCAGNYSVNVRDANGCDTTVTFVISQPPPIVPNLTSTNATCSDACNGAASVAPSGSAGPFTYVWTPPPGGSGAGTNAVTGLCAGNYTVRVTDDVSGCSVLTPFEVTAPPSIDVQGVVTDALCANTCDGRIDITVTGGTGVFTYVWTPPPGAGQGTGSVTGLCPGDYSVLVTDAAGCDTTVTFTVGAPPPLVPTLVTTDVSCAGACDGTASVSVSGGVGGFTYTWTPAVTGAGTPNATQLCAGLYTVLIRDANLCDTTLTFEITEPLPLTATQSQTDVSCGTLCDGTASVLVSGGATDYTYNWDGPAAPAGEGTPDVTGLCAGVHSVLITDANGCTLTQTFTILPAVPIQVTLTLTPASCPGICDGRADAVAVGGSGPFTYSWSPLPVVGDGTPNASGLCPQDYSLTVTDGVGCDTTITFTILAPAAILPNTTQTDVTCAGICDGTITLAPTGGNGVFTYLWLPAGPVGPTATGLCAGDQQVTITSGGCDTTITITIVAPLPITASVVPTSASCSDACDGSAILTTSGGTGTPTFVWDPPPGAGQGTATPTLMCPDDYTVTITDANGCDTTLAFTITSPLPLTATQTQTNVSCGPLCNGTASIVVSGGTTDYSYDWDGPATPTGEGTPNATGLCVGTHTVLVTDARGCTLTLTFDIVPADPILISLALTPASCPGICNGSAVATVTGGAGGFVYSWLPLPVIGDGTPSASGLCPQPYTLTITDAAGCDTTVAFTITAPSAIVPNVTQTDISCAGVCDGSIVLAPTGGNGVFTYVWTPPTGSAGPAANGLCAGDQQVTISSGGCDTTITITITEPLPITVSADVTDVTCNTSCDGAVDLTVAGGTGSYTFLWVPQPGLGQGTANPSDMCPGDYVVTVRDANGCAATLSVTIAAPQPITPSLTVAAESCAGPCTGIATVQPSGGTGVINIFWAPAPGSGQFTNTARFLCAGTNYTVTLTDESGCDTTIAFTIDPSSTIVPNSSSTPVTCPGACDGTATVGPTGGVAPYTFIWSPPPAVQGQPTATGLCEGPIQVIITDSAGCVSISEVLITGPAAITDNAVVTDILCNGDCDASITMDVQGGTGPYTYAWTPPPPVGAGTGVISGLCTGVRNVLVTDSRGCTATFTYIIGTPAPILVNVLKTPSECNICVGAATVIASGGTGVLSIQWLNGDGILVGTDTAITNVCADVYTLIVTDENGCSVTESIPITDSNGESILATGSTTSCPGICDGVINVDFNCGEPPCSIAWTDDFGVQLPDTTNTVTDLCPGDYFVSVTNAQGCVTIDTVTVAPSMDPTLAISSTGVTCTGLCNGTATVGITSGTPPFTFTWSPEPGTGQGTPNVTGLCADVYTVTVTTGSGCILEAEVLITEAAPISVNAALISNVSCSGICDGNVTMAVSGGTPPYTYLWTPAPAAGQGSSAAFGFCAGPFSVLITDNAGCSVTRSYVMPEPLPLQVLTSFTASSCPVCDGTATATVIGGNGQYTFSWLLDGVEISTDQAPVDLCGGLYTLIVRDVFGCEVQRQLQIPSAVGEALTPVNGQTLCGNDCNGEVSVDFTCSLPDCVVQWFDADGNPIGGNSNTLSGLCNGTYTAQVTNANGCVSFAEATVSPSTTIIPNLSTTPATCAGVCDATATVGPVGGVPPYTYLWTPTPGGPDSLSQAIGLCAGVYQVLIGDQSGCDTTVSVLILEPQPLVQVAAVSNIACNAVCNGSIIVTPTGGTAPYTYFWDPVPPNGQGSNGGYDLCAGDYEVTVTDVRGCSVQNTWTVAEPVALQLAGGSIESQCGLCNGSVFVTPSGGTAPYIFTWTQNGNIFGTADTLANLCPGLYTVTVTDSLGCTASQLVPVQDENGEVLTTTGSITSCPGVCDGTAEVAFTCSFPTCTIAWFDAIGTDLDLDTEQISGLCAGLYLVQVTSGNGCVSIDSAYVTEPAPIVANLSTTPVTCFGDCDGVATVGPTGGVEPYIYLWTQNVNGQGTPQATDLCVGTYELTITDDNGAGCSLVTSILILGPDLLIPGVAATPITCNGACDGSIVLSPSGGTPIYVYNWITEPPNGPGSNTGVNLCAQDWVVQITDARGCDTTATITITDPPLLEAQLSSTNNNCFGECIGTANAAVTGGVPPYSLVWSGVAGPIATDTTDIGTLCAGDYSLAITDSSGCSINLPFTITEGAAIEAGLSFTGETCNGPCDGTAAVGPMGGAGGFTFDWQPDPGPGNGQGTDQVSNLCAGNYTITVTDQLTCDTTITFTLLPYTPIANVATVTDVTCNSACDGTVITDATGGIGNLVYTWTPPPSNGPDTPVALELCPGDIALTITDAAGCDTSFTYSITEPLLLEVSVDLVSDASCVDAADGAISTTAFGGEPGYTFAWSGPNGFSATTEDLSGLQPGSYEVTVTDANNCNVVVPVTVNAAVTVVADAGADRTACSSAVETLDGSASTGATTYQWTNDQGDVISDSVMVELPLQSAGTYVYILTVSDGPCSATDTVTITFAPLPIANAGPDQFIFLTDVVTLGGTPSGPAGSTFSWSPDTLVSNATASNPTTSPAVTTWYVLSIVGPNGCLDTDSVLVTVEPNVVIPTGFTPNSDGRNDTWVIDYIELFPECVVEVYNRWGDQLFRSVGYKQPWDGKYRDGYVPVGTYYYVIDLKDERFPEAYTGPLTVIR